MKLEYKMSTSEIQKAISEYMNRKGYRVVDGTLVRPPFDSVYAKLVLEKTDSKGK